MNERLQRVIALYEKRGTIEAVEGGADVARTCLARADERLRAADLLFDSKLFEPTYTTAYDAYRMAADAVALLHGYRTAASAGAHEAALAVAAAALDDSPFTEPTASTFRQGRHSSEYFDPARPAEKTKADAAWAVSQARAACTAVSASI